MEQSFNILETPSDSLTRNTYPENLLIT